MIEPARASSTFELSWIERGLRALDRAGGELVATSLYEDERPPRGVLGLVDWRCYGSVSRMCASGFLRGSAGEKLLFPARPRFPYDKVLVTGLGPRAAFDEETFRRAIAQTLDALVGLAVRKVAIELPGRTSGAIAAPRALELFGEAIAGRAGAFDAITTIDDVEGQRAVEAARVTPGRRNPGARR